MNTVLLTGHAGFIGSQILRDLINLGYFVIGLDNLSEGSDVANYSYFLNHDSFEMICENMENPSVGSKLKNILEKNNLNLDYIINCGADSHVDRSWDQIPKYIDSNIKGPLNLAKIALELKVKKFVQVSTDEVWGGAPQPFTEESIVIPENIYSSSKASAELFLKNFEKAWNLPLVITNGANTYGPRQNEEKVIPKTISKIKSGEKIPLYKTPAQRMWLHVTDHSSGIIAAMERGEIGKRYCVTPEKNNELYTRELMEMICSKMNVDSHKFIEEVPDRLNYDLRYYMSNARIKDELGWEPKKNINEEIDNIIDFYTKD